jgi:biopolymer transport protein ExbD
MALGQVPGMGGDDDGGGSDGVFAEINITPLTDIFLVLLIIFMVTSSVIVNAGNYGAKTGLKVNPAPW